MGLTGALEIGKSGLLASRSAIEVTGNNLANIATRGYHRRSINLSPIRSHDLGRDLFVGRGVQVEQILRHIDEALEARIRNGIADQAASSATKNILAQVEALENEFSDIDLSSHLSSFFNAWGELANNPQDNSLRSIVVQQGVTMAQFIRTLKVGMGDLRVEVDKAIDGSVAAADEFLTRVEQLNHQIVVMEGGRGNAHSLRDERDLVLAELAEHLDISTVEHASGSVDVFVGSLPVVMNNNSRGLEVRRQTVNGQLQIDVIISDDGSLLQTMSGRIGALVTSRTTDVTSGIDTLDQFTNDLIFEINRLHSQGQGIEFYDAVTAEYNVADTAVALNDPDTELEFNIGHGSFQLHVTQKSTDQRTSHLIDIDLDGIGADTTLADLAAAITALPDVTGSITADGRLQVTTSGSDFALSFSDDTSGVLAALGINTYFAGTDASDIEVRQIIRDDVRYVAASLNHQPGDNANALAIADLRSQPLASLNGLSLPEAWSAHVEEYAIRLSGEQAQLEADTVVRDNLESQQQRTSGVNADEEAINLLLFQRTFQASARFLQVVDELIETLLGLA